MASGKTSILELPNEVLDKVFSYLAWTPEESLVPSCPDITNISLSCRTLRDAVLPTLFRNARLKLRWVDGAIAEPGLFKLRQEAPQIFKLIRRVHIQTKFGQRVDSQLEPFTVPLALDNWIAPNASDGRSSELELNHQKRIDQVAIDLFGPVASSTAPPGSSSSIEQVARAFFGKSDDDASQDGNPNIKIGPTQSSLGEHALQYPAMTGPIRESASSPPTATKQTSKDRRAQLDALLICMLMLPSQTQHIIFEAVPTDMHVHLQHIFALQVCAMTLKVFADKLQSLTIISRSLDTPAERRALRSGVPPPPDDYGSTLALVVPELHSVKTLTLASTPSAPNRRNQHSLGAIKASMWHSGPLATNVTHLSLRNIADNRNELYDFIQSFESLRDLTVSDIKIEPNFRVGGANPLSRTPGDPMWLLFLISIRLRHPALRFHLGNLCQWHEPCVLPASATRWLADEAVPVGAKVDFERETRLTEDFASFIPLWEVDDDDRGEMARKDENIGKLVDDAFSSRWRTFANLR